jgi:branched-chain amino acid transport system permease protein
MNGLLFVQLTVSGLVLGSSYALLGVSMNVIYSTTRVFHLAHGAVYAIAAYIAVVGVRNIGLPLGGAVALGLVVGVAVGVGIDRSGYRFLRHRGSTGMIIFIFSLGVSIGVQNLLQIVFGPNALALNGFPINTISVGFVRFTSLDILTVASGWLAIAATIVVLARTSYGRAIRAVRTNQELAAAVGVPVERVYAVVFALGSLLVALAAILYTMGSVATPGMGLQPALLAFVAMFIGGVGSSWGAALGGLLLGWASDISGMWLSSAYSLAIAFAILFIVMIVRPRGLLARRS